MNPLKYSSSEMDDTLTHNYIKKPLGKSLNHFNYNGNNNNDSFISILNSLSNSFNNFYDSTMKTFQDVNHNNLTLSNQILFIKYLLSVIKNKIEVNVEIKNEVEKLSSHLEKIDNNKKILDQNILTINNSCLAYHSHFEKMIKKLKNINFRIKYESSRKNRKNYLIEDNNINYIYNNHRNIINYKRDYDSCKTSIDKDTKDFLKSNSSNRYHEVNSNGLDSFEKKKYKRSSYDKKINNLYYQKIKNNIARFNSSLLNNDNRNDYQIHNNQNDNINIRLFNIKKNNINQYNSKKNNYEKFYYNRGKLGSNKKNNFRCSSVSDAPQNISNIYDNNYNEGNLQIKDNNHINNGYKKLELELALKVITFIKLNNNINNIDDNFKEKIQKFNNLKNYILYLSKNIINKYKKNSQNTDIRNIEEENKLINMKYQNLKKNMDILKQKYNNLLIKNNYISNNISPKKFELKNIKKDSEFNTELLLSQKIADVTNLSHKNSEFLFEINKLQKEKESLIQKLEDKEKSINNDNKIDKNNDNKEIESIISNNNIIKINEENIEKYKKEINQMNEENLKLNNEIKKLNEKINKLNEINNINKNNNTKYEKEIMQKNNEIESLNKKINELSRININNENGNNSKLQEEIIEKINEIENMNKKLTELKQINNKNENKIKEIIEEQKNKEKISKEKIETLTKNNQKLSKENEDYSNNKKSNINEINNLKNTINKLQTKLNNSIKELNSKKISSEENQDSIDNNKSIKNKKIIDEYEHQIELLKETNKLISKSNDELKTKNETILKELNDLKNNDNKTNIDTKEVYNSEQYLIICDKSKDGLKWFLLKDKKYTNDKNNYDNLFWVDNNKIENIKKYNKFKSEEDEMNEIIISNIKKLEEKENIISQLKYKINNYEKNNSAFMDVTSDSKKKMNKSKSEQTMKNKSNNNSHIFSSSKNRYSNNGDFEQNLDDNIKDDYSKNQYFYLEGKGLGLLNK